MTSLADLEIHPPAYPLDRDAFKRALMTGHGRALVHARDFGLADFRDEVLDAATDCKVYDSQIDGQREWWLAQLCGHAGLVDAIIDLPSDDSSLNREMRACLLKEFVLLGHENARPKLYDLCRRSPDSNNIGAISEIIEVDGEKGLLFAARALGEALLADTDFWVGDWELWRFDDLHGPRRASEILTKAASTDPVIRHYLQEVAAYERRKSDRASSEKKVPEPVESVVETILSATERVSRLRRWGNEASPEERAQVAKLLEGESQVAVLRNILWCLKGKGLVDYDEALLTLVFHEDEEVCYFAGQMFSHHVNSQVRAAGFALLERGDVAVATDLLRLNVAGEDAGRIIEALVRRPDEEDDHCTIVNLLEILENGSLWGPAIPLYIHEHSPCMHCREHAIEFLIKNQICPQWVLDEAAFDGSEDIRKLVAGLKA